MTSDAVFVLLHSPLVGPASWEPVREELHLRGYQVIVPRVEADGRPYWRTYADRAVEAITDAAADEVVLVPHSGAGSLAAAIADMAVPDLAGIVFVDAPLPADGMSRLDEMRMNDPTFAEGIRRDLEAGGRYPDWSDALLAPMVPDIERRRALLEEAQPRGLDFFDEPIPAPGWPHDVAAYLQLSAPYNSHAEAAQQRGWPLEQLPLGHFAPVTHPEVIAAAILALTGRIPQR